MKNLFKIILIFLFMGITLNAHASVVVNKPQLEKMIEDKVYWETLSEMKKYGDVDVNIKIINLPIDNIILQNSAPLEIKVTSNFDRFLTYDIKKVVFIQSGKILKTVPVNVRTFVYKDVLIANTRIAPFVPINYSNTKIKRMEVGTTIQDTIAEIDTKYPLVAVKPILQDGLVLRTSVKKQPDILKNAVVKIHFVQNNEFNIELDGIAQSEGSIGDSILVRNTKFNKMHTATIVAPNLVEVRL